MVSLRRSSGSPFSSSSLSFLSWLYVLKYISALASPSRFRAWLMRSCRSAAGFFSEKQSQLGAGPGSLWSVIGLAIIAKPVARLEERL